MFVPAGPSGDNVGAPVPAAAAVGAASAGVYRQRAGEAAAGPGGVRGAVLQSAGPGTVPTLAPQAVSFRPRLAVLRAGR